MGYDIDMLRWTERKEALESKLEQRFPYSQDVQELLGLRFPAGRPKPAPDPTGHNGDIRVLAFVHVLFMAKYNFFGIYLPIIC
jgi:hypothetical protein